jgi:hypothetical protein
MSDRKYRRILFCFAVLIFVTNIFLAFRPPEQLVVRPYQEDSFYLFNAAHHLASGQGLSVDGIKLTNGIQPLIVFLYVPFFWLAGGDKWLAVRLTFLLFGLLNVASMYLMASIVRHLARVKHGEPVKPENIITQSSLVAAGLWAGVLQYVQHNSNGLETGLYAFLILLGIWYAASRNLFVLEAKPQTAYMIYGVILGLGILARIDGTMIVASAMLFAFLYTRRDPKRALGSALTIGVFAGIVSAPWWIFNFVTFGSLMPISGQSESIAGLLAVNLIAAPQILGDIISTLFSTPFNEYPWWMSLGWFGLNLGIMTAVAMQTHVIKTVRARYDLRAIAPVLLAGACMFVYYVFFFSAPHFMSRYFHPIRIAWLLLVSLAIPDLWSFGKLAIRRASKWKRSITYLLFSSVLLGAIVFNLTRYTKAFTIEKSGQAYWWGVWANQHKDGAVGMTSSGAAGFTAANVVNLDGKVNVDALRARQNHQLTGYIVNAGMRYVADGWEIDSAIIAEAKPLGAHFVVIDTVAGSIVIKRTDTAATTEKNNLLWRPLE